MIRTIMPLSVAAYTPLLAFKTNRRNGAEFGASSDQAACSSCSGGAAANHDAPVQPLAFLVARSCGDSIRRQEPEFEGAPRGLRSATVIRGNRWPLAQQSKGIPMSLQDDNKAVVGRWFTDFWGKTCNLSVVDEIAAPDMLLKYSLHEPRNGHADIKAFMTDFRAAFPDLNFWGTADLIAEGDYVVGQWEGGGTHTGPLSRTS